MKILLTGGGTGGHITPLLAVAHELKKSNPDCVITYIGERDGKFDHIVDGDANIDVVKRIFAGKYRRYHGESTIKRLTDIKTLLFNFRDLVLFVIGTFQAIFLLMRQRPDVIFLKGGFVGVPIGLAAALLRIPFVTHDSDAIPGLANRIVGRWAKIHAVAQKVDMYAYSPKNTVQVGVIVAEEFDLVDKQVQNHFKQQLNLNITDPLLVITGGSSGAQRLNQAMVKIVPDLISDFNNLNIIHQAGHGKTDIYGEYSSPRLKVIDFMKPMHQFTGAADIIVARSSANTLAELGVQGKATIAVANPLLTDGHQIKNAEELAKLDAVISVNENSKETDQVQLNLAIRELLSDPVKREKVAANLHENTIQGAAKVLAKILMEQSKVGH
ncbi:MAG: glycosyltransferase [Patescibacteria group bacterium]